MLLYNNNTINNYFIVSNLRKLTLNTDRDLGQVVPGYYYAKKHL